MARYYAVASAIVAVLAFAFFLVVRARSDLRVASVDASVPPKVTVQERDASERAASRFTATGDWVMAALPGCFSQREERTGPLAFVRAAVPPGVARLPAGTRFAQGECTVDVRANDVVITRGADRMLVSPPAELYRSGALVILVHPAKRHPAARIFTAP